MADKDSKSIQNKDKKQVAKPKRRRFHPIRFVKEVISELKKVTWPTRKELLKHTGVVIAFVVALTLVVGLMDAGLSWLFQLVFST